MPFKNKEEANAWSRKHYAENPEVRARHKQHQDKWEKEHKEERNEQQAKWMRDHRFKNYTDARAYEFAREMKKYGTTVEWYRDRLIEQSGVCTLCNHLSHHHGTIQRLQVDHDHTCCDLRTKSCGKCLRGLLCADCNILLSYLENTLKDTLSYHFIPNSWTANAVDYLAYWYSFRLGPNA